MTVNLWSTLLTIWHGKILPMFEEMLKWSDHIYMTKVLILSSHYWKQTTFSWWFMQYDWQHHFGSVSSVVSSSLDLSILFSRTVCILQQSACWLKRATTICLQTWNILRKCVHFLKSSLNIWSYFVYRMRLIIYLPLTEFVNGASSHAGVPGPRPITVDLRLFPSLIG